MHLPCLPQRHRSAFKSVPPLSHAVHDLHNRRAQSVQQCLTDLSSLRNQLKIIPLFRTLFPGLFRRSFHPKHARSAREAFHSLFLPFLNAINKQYFPVDDLDLNYIIEYFPSISLPLYNYDVESEFEDAPFADRITAAMLGSYSYAPTLSQIRAEAPGIQYPPCWADDKHWCNVDIRLLSELCSQHPAPIRHYPLLFSTLAHDTGCIFLDPSYDSGDWNHEFVWSIEDVHTLKSHWTRAKTIMKTNVSTIAAIGDNSLLWNSIFHCWADMCRQTPPRES